MNQLIWGAILAQSAVKHAYLVTLRTVSNLVVAPSEAPAISAASRPNHNLPYCLSDLSPINPVPRRFVLLKLNKT